MRKNILVVEDKPSQLRLSERNIKYNLSYHSVGNGCNVSTIGMSCFSTHQPDLVLLDMEMTGQLYIKIIHEIKLYKPQWPVIALTPYGNDTLAIEAITAGANDYISKPASLERLGLTIDNVLKIQNMGEAIARLERSKTGHTSISDIIGSSPIMRKIIAQAEMLSSSDIAVWIDGEKGTGKELFARAIHGSNLVSEKPFVLLDCNKFTEATTEIFVCGQRKAVDTIQLFARKMIEANGGTLYLKNLGSLPPRLQRCLFEALETGTMQETDEILTDPIHFRVIIGSAKPVGDMIIDEAFGPLQRKLYGMVVSLPPLRDRKEDIAELTRHFIAMHAASENRTIPNISDDAIKLLESSPWPGNVMQLSRTIHRAVLLCNQNELDVGTIRLIQQLESVNYSPQNNAAALAPTLVDVKGHIKKLKNIEEEVIRFALVHSGGSMTRAARNLGIGRSTLYRKVSGMEFA